MTTAATSEAYSAWPSSATCSSALGWLQFPPLL